jgi:hypothetical protein
MEIQEKDDGSFIKKTKIGLGGEAKGGMRE